MRTIPVEEAVGAVLPHDITRILPGEFKGVGFRKGHVIREEDIPELKKIGKNFIYVLNLPEGQLHEDEAALRIAQAISGKNIEWTSPKEGKSTLLSKKDGLLKIDVNNLLDINRLDHIAVSTIRTMTPVRVGQTIAATRVIPLIIDESRIKQVEQIAQRSSVLRIMPYRTLKVGAVVTGTEVYQGLIKDGFDEFVGYKVEMYGCDLIKKIIVPDDVDAIAGAISQLLELGSELILTTGGLSVDPDDVTPSGVRRTGATIINYGSPVFPGAMVLYAKHGDVPILGLPACVYYARTTILDTLLPRILAGEEIVPDTFAQMGHGGLCRECETCHFPNCGFGS
ncbi:MAG: molybdopterin-binding protein [Deltaproteobacteria bacterium]|nr:molybdopterin-binding protein [Deltaproteobacteria bacterium]